jgi:hypothetical protein
VEVGANGPGLFDFGGAAQGQWNHPLRWMAVSQAPLEADGADGKPLGKKIGRSSGRVQA